MRKVQLKPVWRCGLGPGPGSFKGNPLKNTSNYVDLWGFPRDGFDLILVDGFDYFFGSLIFRIFDNFFLCQILIEEVGAIETHPWSGRISLNLASFDMVEI